MPKGTRGGIPADRGSITDSGATFIKTSEKLLKVVDWF